MSLLGAPVKRVLVSQYSGVPLFATLPTMPGPALLVTGLLGVSLTVDRVRGDSSALILV